MCLYTKETVARKTTKDITVYKLVRVKEGAEKSFYLNGKIVKGKEVSITSAAQEFKYTLGKLYKRKDLEIKKFAWDSRYQVNQGFHAYPTLKSVPAKYHLSIIECVIPAGSLYVRGTNNGKGKGIVSNQLKVVRVC